MDVWGKYSQISSAECEVKKILVKFEGALWPRALWKLPRLFGHGPCFYSGKEKAHEQQHFHANKANQK